MAKAKQNVETVETETVVATPEDSTIAEEVPVTSATPEVLNELAYDDISAFVAWAQGGENDDLVPFVVGGLLNEDHSLTDLGVEALEGSGVIWSNINLLELGIPVTYLLEHKNYTIQSGSTLRVLFGGYDEALGAKYWDCSAGERLPLTRIYQNRNHKFFQVRYPVAHQPKTVYTHED